MDFGGTLGELLYQLPLLFGGVCNFIVVDGLRAREIELVGSLDVRCLAEMAHQLRQVGETGKPCPGAVARPLRGKLNGGGCLAKGGCPAVEVGKPLAANGVVLEIAHHGVDFRHAVGHRRTRGEHNALAACDFIHIPALHQHIAGFLGVSGG